MLSLFLNAIKIRKSTSFFQFSIKDSRTKEIKKAVFPVAEHHVQLQYQLKWLSIFTAPFSPRTDDVIGEQNLSVEEYNSQLGKGLRPRTLSVSPSLQQHQLLQQQSTTSSLRHNSSFTDFDKSGSSSSNKKKENNQVRSSNSCT